MLGDMAQGSSKLPKFAPKRTSKPSTNPKKGQRTIPPKKLSLIKAAAKKKVADVVLPDMSEAEPLTL